MVVARAALLVLADMVFCAGQALRFIVMRKSVQRSVHALLACGRRGVSGAFLAALALLCASCETTGGFREIGGTLEEIFVGGSSARVPVDTTREVLSPSGDLKGVYSVFDETVFQCRDAPQVLGTAGEILRPSDEGLLWTITEILRS